MMRKSVRLTMMMAVGLMLALLSPGAAVAPAYAAGTIKVGCPGATFGGPTGIQDAVDSTGGNKTILVCGGLYDPVVINSKNKLKLVAKGFPFIVPAGSGYSGALIEVDDSTNVTIQGFFLDGYGNFDPTLGTYKAGILYFNSSGVITKNYIVRITPPSLDNDNQGIGIDVYNNLAGSPKVVKVVKNTVEDFQAYGIAASGNVKVAIQNNRLDASASGGAWPVGISVYNAPAGSVVSKNTITMDSNYNNGYAASGIDIFETSKAKVTGNKISNVEFGISVLSQCVSVANANKNSITANQTTGAYFGIRGVGFDLAGVTTCPASVSNNTIKSNKLTSLTFYGVGILFTTNVDEVTFPPVVNGNKATGNKVYGYFDVIVDTVGGNVIAPNKSLPPPVGAAPAGPLSMAEATKFKPFSISH